jgi:phosphomannomutase
MTESLIFDMDGTLTPATQKISKEMMTALSKVKPGHQKYLVTGSDLDKVIKQIPEEFLLRNFKKVFTCNGTRVYDTHLDLDDETKPFAPDLVHSINLLDHYSQADINHLTSRLLSIAAESHTKYKTGTFIEWRESQINFSVIGRNCSLEQREDYVKWDNKSGERKKIVDKLNEEFQGWGLAFKLGGQISIDITRKEWDKTYALNFIPTDPANCIFFGDKIIKGGNDYEIAMVCGKYFDIETPEDTIILLEQFS